MMSFLSAHVADVSLIEEADILLNLQLCIFDPLHKVLVRLALLVHILPV